MKSVTPDALVIEFTGDGIVVCECAVGAVKGGVKAGDLRQRGEARADRFYRREIEGLVQGRERNIAFETAQHVFADQNRPVVIRAAMDDPVPDSGRADFTFLAKPGPRSMECVRYVQHFAWRIRYLGENRAVSRSSSQLRACADAVYLTLDLAFKITVRRDLEELELYARRACIGDEDSFHEIYAAGSAVALCLAAT